MIAFPCPKCHARLEASDNKGRAHTKCPHCGCPVQVPAHPVPVKPSQSGAPVSEPEEAPTQGRPWNGHPTSRQRFPKWVVAIVSIGVVALLGAVVVLGLLWLKRGGAISDSEMIDFFNNTPKYKGKTLTMRLCRYEGMYHITPRRDGSGYDVEFFVSRYQQAEFRIWIFVPSSLGVPAGELAYIVTFVCKDGDLSHGNEAKEIKRER